MNIPFKVLPLLPLAAAVQKIKNYFFDNRYDASALVVFRIGTALILLLQFLQLLPDLLAFLGESALIRPDISALEVPAYVLSASQLAAWISEYGHLSLPEAMFLLGTLYVLSLVFIMAGLFTRISALLCLVLHVSFVYSGHFFSYGVDYFLNIFLFYILLFPVNTSCSADKKIFRLKPVNPTPYIRLLQLHLGIVYFIGGLAKALGINWWNGISLWKAINRPGITKYDLQFLAGYAWLFTALGILTIVIELLYPVFIHLRSTRKLWLALTCLLHLSIAVVLRLPFFAAVMILFNLVAFYLPQQSTSIKH